MSKRILRLLASVAVSLALATGALTLATVPAHAASFGVSLSVSDSSVTRCEGVNLIGKVTPKPSSRTVYVQERLLGTSTWRTVAKVSTTSYGNFRTTVVPTDAGSRHYRVYKPKAGKRKAGYSKQFLVEVLPQSGTVAVCSASSRLAGGGTVTISGTGLRDASQVTFTPRVEAGQLAAGFSQMPAVAATFTVIDDATLRVVVPPGLGGTSTLTVTTPVGQVTTGFVYKKTWRSPTTFEQQVLDELNKRRAKARTCRGKSMPKAGALGWDGTLSDLALSHGRDLATRQDVYPPLDHVTYGTRQFRDRFDLAGISGGFGEILALSPSGSSAKAVVDQWMSSTTGHCESVMSRSWKKAGVGVASGKWGAQPSIWTNVDFQ